MIPVQYHHRLPSVEHKRCQPTCDKLTRFDYMSIKTDEELEGDVKEYKLIFGP